jgi:glycosyltransferase 2 family protein
MKRDLFRSENWKWGFIFFRIGIAVSLLIILFAVIGLDNILRTFREINLLWGALVALCLCLLFFLGALNVWILLRALRFIPLADFVVAYSYSWAVSLISPGQAGDASLILFMRRYDVPLRQSGAAYTLDKAITVLLFGCVACVGAFVAIEEFKDLRLPFLVFGLSIVTGSLVAALVFSKFPAGMGERPSRWGRFKQELNTFREKWRVLLLNFGMTTLKWVVVSLTYWLAFRSFGVPVAWRDIAVIPIVATLVGYIPVSLAGIGTVEVTAVLLFGKVGVEQPAVVSAYLLLRAMQFLLAILLLWVSLVLRKARGRQSGVALDTKGW